jgi:hypothetical protein
MNMKRRDGNHGMNMRRKRWGWETQAWDEHEVGHGEAGIGMGDMGMGKT